MNCGCPRFPRWVTLSRNNALGLIDLKSRSLAQIPVGMAPYAVLSGPGDKLYVSNWAGRRPKPGEPVANSSGSLVLVNPQNGVVPKIDRTLSVEPENMDTHLKMQ